MTILKTKSKLKLIDISKKFDQTEVLKKTNIEVKEKEFIVILGPSGCGKTTLLRIIAGLEKQTSGDIIIEDVNVTKFDPQKRDVSMVFQNYGLYPHMKVRQNLEYPLKIHKITNREKIISKWSRKVKIEEYLDRYPKQLSGGQRQRVALARALVRNPKIHLMDEPLSNLDASLRLDMRSELKHLHEELGSTIIYVTHDQIEAMTLADKIVILNNGNVEQVGTPDEIYNNPSNIFVAEFIGVPKMNILSNGIESLLKNFNLKSDAYLGIRPEHIHTNGDGEIKLDIKVDLVENLGSEKIIYATFKGQELRIKTSDNISQNLKQISFSKKKIFLFDNNKKRYHI
mgnify:CR=1 FL=1